MPHVVVKLWPGQTEEKKQQLARAVADSVMQTLGSSDASLSVAIEEIPSDQWKARVYEPEIKGAKHGLYKEPGYTM